MPSQPHHQAAYLDGIAIPLRISSAPTLAPGPSQILIKTAAVAINPVDWKMQDTGRALSAYPFILGRDLAGHVVAVGRDVETLQPGARVLAQSLSLSTKKLEEGTFQEYVLADVKSTASISDAMSYEQACVLPLAVATSASALFSPTGLNLPLPEHGAQPRGTGAVLIWGGSSSVGCAGIQLAVAAGCEVYTTCSKKNFGLVEALGARKVFDYRSPSVVGDIVAELQELTKVVGVFDGESKVLPPSSVLGNLVGGLPSHGNLFT
jgi:NADPH:quinone reductase-like Zn-dependent oxidoreductase